MPAAAPGRRLAFLDCLRGLVMVLMTLDHTRDFFSNAHFSPTNLDLTTPALFLTRWITHFCAPAFVFLAGTSAYLWSRRYGAQASPSRFLLERGAMLLLLTTTVEAWAWNFRNDFQQIDGGVLWAIAWSMLLLAGLVKLPPPWLAMIGAALVAGHNAFDGLQPGELGGFGPWWAVLHTGDEVTLGRGWSIRPYYPLLPWPGVMLLGFGFGRLLDAERWRRPGRLAGLGAALLGCFVLLRLNNGYGDPQPWRNYADPAFTLLSFLNCHKYPPSLAYLLLTLGGSLLACGFFRLFADTRFAVLQVFGRTPLLFYLAHLYVIHALAVAAAWAGGGPAAALLGGGIWNKALPADYGYGLAGVYGWWLLVLAVMYPLCRGFEKLKARRPEWRWLRYF